MSTDDVPACPAHDALVRIASARWTPYIADTLRKWSRDALNDPAACTSTRTHDCVACSALRKIGNLEWDIALARQIQDKARETLALLELRAIPPRDRLRVLA
ncbi:MAG: hypothetical protein WAS23_15985 [Dokdonella sp.]|uniref:hypothetical protein n=1 Tax=Dokdonella sp. TaxID=2291710 RepID=UPI002C74548F|nr:hypothetical protein [Dokdonella sp.]HOX71174.1 hypothetical protein [Dokdonella sp.]HPG93156.1 hypothetical protein [Dokdonella sp.]HPN78748.1 hypothetical protein [Dokdonella sp.]